MLSTFHLIHNYVVMTVISEEPGCSVLGCNMYVTTEVLPLREIRPSLEVIPVTKGTLWNFPCVIRSMGSAGRNTSCCLFSPSTVGLKNTAPRSSSCKECVLY